MCAVANEQADDNADAVLLDSYSSGRFSIPFVGLDSY